jgi:hypothetical protein
VVINKTKESLQVEASDIFAERQNGKEEGRRRQHIALIALISPYFPDA